MFDLSLQLVRKLAANTGAASRERAEQIAAQFVTGATSDGSYAATLILSRDAVKDIRHVDRIGHYPPHAVFRSSLNTMRSPIVHCERCLSLERRGLQGGRLVKIA
jgi:hypothetical protein